METIIALVVLVFLLAGFVSAREGRVAILLVSLIWGFGKWTWKSLQHFALGEADISSVMAPLLLSLLLGGVYRIIRSKISVTQTRYAGFIAWGLLSLFVATRNPVAAILFMLICDPGLVLSDLNMRRGQQLSSLAVLYWITVATTQGRDEFSREVMFLLGLINLSVVAVPKAIEWFETALVQHDDSTRRGRLRQCPSSDVYRRGKNTAK